MPHTIILVRHGETQDNVEHKLQGSRDTPLNEAGHKQAQLVAQRLKNLSKVNAIYSSHQSRAKATASYITGALSMTLKIDERLREDHLGIFEGQNWEHMEENLQSLWEELFASRTKNDWEWNKHSGETLASFYNRLQDFHTDLESHHKDETIILVTHGGTKNRYLELLKLKDNTDYIGFGNTSITILVRSGSGYEIELLNDTSHLTSSS